jgi:hypothetical protein
MRTLIFTLLTLGVAHAADRPIELRPLDLTERVQICGKKTCTSMVLSDLIRNLQVERSGGGDIIGNGGGLAEQNFTYALTQLADFIQETLKAGLVTGEDATQLKRIAKAAREEAMKADKLIFLSGKNNPGFFDADNDPEVRLAKTGLSQHLPIFVNLDLLYRKTGDVVEMLPLPVMVASLVHELGHNVGLENHAYLDYLGARVRQMVEREYQRTARQLTEATRIEMVSINLGAYSLPRLSLTVGDKLVSFEKELYQILQCRNGSIPKAARLSNQHWQRPVEFSANWVAPFRAWVALTCVNARGQAVLEDRDLVLDLTIDLTDELEPQVRTIQVGLRD